MGSLKIEEVGEDEWVFVWPKVSNKATDLFFEALDYADNGKISKAQQLLKKALEIYPEHIDILHHLSMFEKNGRELNEKAVKIGLDAFPKEFNEKSKLEWGWTENRPFLRACHTKGLILMEERNIDEAVKVFNQIISWNPNDNQGIRDILADIFSNRGMWNDMVELSKKYPDDYGPSMNFGLALALYKRGEKEKATGALKKAIKNFPLCCKILLEDNPKKPKSDMPGYITMGGADQAYEFWESQRSAWKEEDLRNWLKSSSLHK